MMARLVELVGACETGRSRAYNSNFFASASFGDACDHPAFCPTSINDGALVVLNGDCGLDHAENA